MKASHRKILKVLILERGSLLPDLHSSSQSYHLHPAGQEGRWHKKILQSVRQATIRELRSAGYLDNQNKPTLKAIDIIKKGKG